MAKKSLRVLICLFLSVIGAHAAGPRRERPSDRPGSAAPMSAPVLPVDADGDGINDTLEQKLAELYAPVIYIEPDESNYPVNVDWFLAKASLQYHEDCGLFNGGDTDDDVGPFPIGRQLLGPAFNTFWIDGPDCGEDDHGYTHPPHRRITTIATDPDGQTDAGAQTTGYSDQQTFVLTDLVSFFRPGSTNPLDWKTYYHVYPSFDGGVMIQYWHVFAYNEFGGGFDNHGGDWDASIQVRLKPDLTLNGVWFSRHKDDHPGSFFCAAVDENCPAPQVRLFDSTHPVVTIDGGGHAAFRSPADWATCNCRVLEGVTGPLGTIVWTRDDDAFDNPAALRRAEFVCDTNNICHLALSDPSGGIVWKTWSDGTVVASGDLTIPITSPSAHGGLVNLGEYNPCTPETCVGSAQASTLLAGQFHPLNDAFWLRYEGRWGSIGSINSGPRGPVFQGFEDRHEGHVSLYRAWYNEGADVPASNDGAHPWRVPPITTATIEGPSYAAGGVTFVSAATRVALSASQSALADRFGPLSTNDRAEPAGSFPAFATYVDPFAIAPPAPVDGVFNVDYFSVDGLGNIESPKTLVVTLDTTPPTASIAQPAAAVYPHSAAITLNYSVDDGAGSGVASVTPAIDGALTAPDGTSLASGQSVNLLTLALGSHTFSIDSADHVGNSGTQSVSFTIIVTVDSIRDDVTQFLAAGRIENGGLANSLLAKLAAAERERTRGSCDAAAQHYETFIKELQAQSGKGVEAAAAGIMIADAEYLIAHCS